MKHMPGRKRHSAEDIVRKLRTTMSSSAISTHAMAIEVNLRRPPGLHRCHIFVIISAVRGPLGWTNLRLHARVCAHGAVALSRFGPSG